MTLRTAAHPDQLARVIAAVFGIPADTVTEESRPETIPQWDSMSHINLVLALEDEFGVSFSAEDMVEMLSVRLIRLILAERGVTA